MLRAEQPTFGTQSTTRQLEIVNAFMRRVYWWMTGGLGLTAVVAFLVLTQPVLQQLFFTVNEQGYLRPSMIIWVLFIAEIFLVFRLSGSIPTMQVGSAKTLFLVYAGLNGITLTPLLLAFTGESIFQAFLITAGTFGVTTIYASVTKRDLSGIGSFIFMGVIGLIIASIVNIFLGSGMLQFIICVAGVIIFTGLAAYSTQMFRAMALQAANEVTATKMAILGALNLYISFVGLFQYILILFGNRE
jgi:FtsH-binding integral membrane protein